MVRGKYGLASRLRAKLVASVTSTSSKNAQRSGKRQQTPLARGTGRFEVELPLEVTGYPNLRMYDAEGDLFGVYYFGSDEWLLPTSHWQLLGPRRDDRNPDPKDRSFRLLVGP